VARPVYTVDLGTFELTGGGVTIQPLDPAFAWIVRDIAGVAINPVVHDSALEFRTAGWRFLRYANPPNGVINLQWSGRVAIPNIPGPPSYEIAAIGDPSSSWEFTVTGYALSLP
jgi:hypothetical protein